MLPQAPQHQISMYLLDGINATRPPHCIPYHQCNANHMRNRREIEQRPSANTCASGSAAPAGHLHIYIHGLQLRRPAAALPGVAALRQRCRRGDAALACLLLLLQTIASIQVVTSSSDLATGISSEALACDTRSMQVMSCLAHAWHPPSCLCVDAPHSGR
jgi:hypothetical protein